MMRLTLLGLVGVVHSVSAVKDVVWAGRATNFADADNWKGKCNHNLSNVTHEKKKDASWFMVMVHGS